MLSKVYHSLSPSPRDFFKKNSDDSSFTVGHSSLSISKRVIITQQISSGKARITACLVRVVVRSNVGFAMRSR